MKESKPPARRRQVAALCWRREAGAIRILLITSRETKRWVVPKGNRMKGRSDWDAAAQEAREEAGVHGVISPHAIGQFSYDKRLSNGATRPCVVEVFPLEVLIQQGGWEESDQRQRRWMTLEQGAASVIEPELSKLIARFSPPAD